MRQRPRWAQAIGLALAIAGTLGLAGSWSLAQRYVALTRALNRLAVDVARVQAAPRLVVDLRYRNGGPWPVVLLEVQVLAWQDGRYAGAASVDLRDRPLEIPAAGGEQLLQVPFASAAPPGTATVWRLAVSGRLQLPVAGSHTFEYRVEYHPGEGSS
ncbi:hypothetical protein U7230_04520 [Carboxydochorda subterranea]|uniref:DUF3426 domain-containing protein n=1 Tax=Carboxydichorda subterranea TaxID=3109565 RepID=A0ABZ1C1T8_9FIRM|nr:hypothetical protein [Limnochorda sp. L945t]WRP18277.1 hypothetical protein U7230_04520 [Limnochorda sp. L945t]